jgi:hypothetical protein
VSERKVASRLGKKEKEKEKEKTLCFTQSKTQPVDKIQS